MSVTRRSSSPGWWAWFTRRSNSCEDAGVAQSAPLETRPLDPGIPPAGDEALPEWDSAVEHARLVVPVSADADEVARSFAEMIGAGELSMPECKRGPRSPPVAADETIRDRTLAALHQTHQIPSLQSLATAFIEVANRSEVSIDEVVEAIENDPALCVRVLSMANSAFIHPEQQIEDLPSAVHMLGVVRVRRLEQALFTLRDACPLAEGLDWRHLWIHAIATAAIAEELDWHLSTRCGPHLYLAALLHDVGKIVLSTIDQEAYRDVLVASWNDWGRLEDLERKYFGVDHREAGTMFAWQTKLPDVVIEAIAHHNRPEAPGAHQVETALVCVANYLSKLHGLGFSGSRLETSDGDFDNQSAWAILEAACGQAIDRDLLEGRLKDFISGLRADLRSLREAA